MKKRFAYRISGSFMFVLTAFALVCLGSICYGLFSIFGIFNLSYGSLPLEILSIVLSVVLIVLVAFVFSAGYCIDTQAITLRLGFWDVTRGKFKVENVVKIVKATNTDKLYVNIYVNNAPQIMLINIKPAQFDEFASCLKTMNPKIFYEQADIN